MDHEADSDQRHDDGRRRIGRRKADLSLLAPAAIGRRLLGTARQGGGLFLCPVGASSRKGIGQVFKPRFFGRLVSKAVVKVAQFVT